MLRIICSMLLLTSAIFGAPKYLVGRDPSWYPLDFKQKTAPLNAFVNALVDQINLTEGSFIHIVPSDYATLLPGLEQNFYNGALTSLPPNSEATDIFDFSDPFLPLGPLIVVNKDSKATSLDDLKDKIVGISPHNRSVLIVQKFPTIIIKNYDHVPQAFMDLSQKKIDAVLVDNLEAKTLLQDGFGQTLKIVSSPLSNQGLRLIALKNKEPRLIHTFNRGLRKLQQNGQYARILRKFLNL